MKMYFKYIKYMQIVFQLQNTNYFCYVNKMQNTKYMKCISIAYYNYLYFNYYTTLQVGVVNGDHAHCRTHDTRHPTPDIRHTTRNRSK